MNIIQCKESDLKELYDDSALTMEGLNADEDNLKAFADWLEEHGCKMKTDDFYVIKGALMNRFYHLTGDNAYKDELTIVCIKLSDLSDVHKIVTARFEIGGRWFDDVVENNLARERGE